MFHLLVYITENNKLLKAAFLCRINLTYLTISAHYRTLVSQQGIIDNPISNRPNSLKANATLIIIGVLAEKGTRRLLILTIQTTLT